MTAIRTWAFGIVAWSGLAASATAAPMSWFGSQADLTAWYANKLNSAGNFYAPRSSDTVSNFLSNWFASNSSQTEEPVSSEKNRTVAALDVAEIASGSVSAPATFAEMGLSRAEGEGRASAYLNFGSGPYADAPTLTVGSPGPWYNSGAVASVYGGVPNADQRADFVQSVMSNVERTFETSGVDLKLTDDPQAPTAHTMSVVSGASYGGNPDAIGITNIGGNGFSFIDKLSYASEPDELAWAVAHNISHELMHAIGVATHPDETGEYLDAAVANWGMLTDPDAKFSPAAIAMMRSATSGGLGAGGLGLELLADPDHADEGFGPTGAQFVEMPVPEPSTIAIWTLSGLLAGYTIRRRFGRG